MAYYYDSNSAAQYSMQLLRGQMVSQIISGQVGQPGGGIGGIGGLSLNEFMLGVQGRPEKPRRTGTDIMNDALTGLIRSDARMLRQASKNMGEGGALVKIAAEGLKSIGSKLTRMQDIITTLRSDTSQKGILLAEYNDLVQSIGATVTGTEYNGIKLLDGSAWDADERVNKSSNGNTGKISLQAGKEATDLTLFNLEGLKTALNPLVFPNDPSDLTTWNARLDKAENMVTSAGDLIGGMRHSYEARSGLYASEASFYERQAGILEEAAKRSKPNDEDSLRDAILDILLRDQGGIFEQRT